MFWLLDQESVPIMPAYFLMLRSTYHSQNYASIIYQGLALTNLWHINCQYVMSRRMGHKLLRGFNFTDRTLKNGLTSQLGNKKAPSHLLQLTPLPHHLHHTQGRIWGTSTGRRGSGKWGEQQMNSTVFWQWLDTPLCTNKLAQQKTQIICYIIKLSHYSKLILNTLSMRLMKSDRSTARWWTSRDQLNIAYTTDCCCCCARRTKYDCSVLCSKVVLN